VSNILIADDHAILRRGLKKILQHALPDAICGEAQDAREVMEHVRAGPWDLLILDITMPGRSGLDVLRDVKTLRPDLPVLILSMHPEDQYAKRVLRAGASGYMNKESAPEELLKAVAKVLGGGSYVSPRLAESLARDLTRHPDRSPHEILSDREFEVLRRLGSGRTVAQIADDLNLSATTVSTYRARLLDKMRMTTTAELIRYAVENNLIE
jgi:two-component system, NarL family, invasion response regulator UvrY